MKRNSVKPWMVALTLGVVGVVGATSVAFVGAELHRRDRAAIVRWEVEARATIADLRDAGVALDGAAVSQDLSAVRDRLVRARDRLRALSTPSTLDDARVGFLATAEAFLAAIDAARTSGASAFRAAVLDAGRRLDGSRAILGEVQCRAVVPVCVRG